MSVARIAVLTTGLCLMAAAAHAGINFAGAELTSVSPQPEHMVSGDLNNDGRADIVVVSKQSKELNVYLGADTPSRFAPARVYRFGSTLQGLALGDINADQRLDIVVADQAANVVWIMLGRGDGTFLMQYQNNVPNARHPVAVAIGNFDQVGAPELAVADDRLGKIFVLRNDNANEPRFSRLVDLNPGEGPEDVRAVDLNGDGNLDLMSLNLGGPRVKEVSMMIWRRAQLGVPDFAEPTKFTVGEKPFSMVVADFNNDGSIDCGMLNRPASSSNDEIDILLNDGTGVMLPPLSLPVPCPFFTGGQPCRAQVMTQADFDGNGTVDLAVTLADPRRSRGSASSLADAMQIFSGRGDGGFVPGGVLSTQKAPVSIASGDVTGDGKIDVVIANRRTLSVQTFINVSSPADKGNGESCLLGEECISSRCTNGVCCASQCSLVDNEVCNVPGRRGTCTPLPPGIVECDVEFPEDCDSGFCVDGFCCDDACDGGRCDLPGFIGLCIPGLPDGEPCDGDDRECASRFCSDNFICCRERCEAGFCDELGVCHDLLDLGDICNLDEECLSNVCDVFDGICCNRRCDEIEEFCNVDGRCERFDAGPTATPDSVTLTPNVPGTPTPRLTPAPDGQLCANGGECLSTFCVDGVCCQVSSCGVDQHCEEGSGQCVAGAPVTRTPTRTPVPVTGGPENCGGQCPPSQCINNVCVVSSTSSGCSTGGTDAPAGGNLLVASLLPFGLWFGRRWQLRQAAARARRA